MTTRRWRSVQVSQFTIGEGLLRRLRTHTCLICHEMLSISKFKITYGVRECRGEFPMI